MPRHERNDALLNGALIGLGELAVLDNVIAHWLLRLHRAIPGPLAGYVEVGLVVLGSGMLIGGIWRELRARNVRRQK